MPNIADPDQLASSESMDLQCLQRQRISKFSRTRVNSVGNPHDQMTRYTEFDSIFNSA